MKILCSRRVKVRLASAPEVLQLEYIIHIGVKNHAGYCSARFPQSEDGDEVVNAVNVVQKYLIDKVKERHLGSTATLSTKRTYGEEESERSTRHQSSQVGHYKEQSHSRALLTLPQARTRLGQGEGAGHRAQSGGTAMLNSTNVGTPLKALLTSLSSRLRNGECRDCDLGGRSAPRGDHIYTGELTFRLTDGLGKDRQ